MTEQREKNAYNEYIVMPRLRKLFTMLGRAGVDGYLTFGQDESLGINATLDCGEVFISYKAYNVNYVDLLKVRYDACDMVLSIKCAAECVNDPRELLVPEEIVAESDDLSDLLEAYESGIWLKQEDLTYDRERLSDIVPLLVERDVPVTDNSGDRDKPHILIESVDRFIELSVVSDDIGRPLILMRAPKTADSDLAVSTVFFDNGAVKSGELYEREIGIFEKYLQIW